MPWTLLRRLMLDIVVWFSGPTLFLFAYVTQHNVSRGAVLPHLFVALLALLTVVTARLGLYLRRRDEPDTLRAHGADRLSRSERDAPLLRFGPDRTRIVGPRDLMGAHRDLLVAGSAVRGSARDFSRAGRRRSRPRIHGHFRRGLAISRKAGLGAPDLDQPSLAHVPPALDRRCNRLCGPMVPVRRLSAGGSARARQSHVLRLRQRVRPAGTRDRPAAGGEPRPDRERRARRGTSPARARVAATSYSSSSTRCGRTISV